MLAREEEDGHRAERDARRPATTRSRSGLGQSHQSGAKTDDQRVEMRAEPRDLVALEVGDLEERAVRGRPDGLRRGCRRRSGRSRTRAAGGRRARRHPGGERGAPPATSSARGASRGRDRPLEQRPPARAEDVPRWRAPRRSRGPRAPIRSARPASAARRRTAAGERLGVAGRDEQRVLRRRSAARARPACRP